LRYYASEKLPVCEVALFIVKILLSVALLLTASELAKRSTFLGAVVIAMPVTSILAMTWLYWDTRDAEKVAAFAKDIFFLVPPSLLFFLPFLFQQKSHWPFWLNFSLGFALMAGGMLIYRFLVK
jgi:TRAP-type mannitol/chloroaromatic compound transport system permease large subunit